MFSSRVRRTLNAFSFRACLRAVSDARAPRDTSFAPFFTEVFDSPASVLIRRDSVRAACRPGAGPSTGSLSASAGLRPRVTPAVAVGLAKRTFLIASPYFSMARSLVGIFPSSMRTRRARATALRPAGLSKTALMMGWYSAGTEVWNSWRAPVRLRRIAASSCGEPSKYRSSVGLTPPSTAWPAPMPSIRSPAYTEAMARWPAMLLSTLPASIIFWMDDRMFSEE